MGSKLHLEWLTEHRTGLGTKYRWTGSMLGMKMDFIVEVTGWEKAQEKTWETVGKSKMIIYSWYRMHFSLKPVNDGTEAILSITYQRPEGWLAKLISFLFADWYCNWCLKSMLGDTKKRLEVVNHSINQNL